MKKLSIKEIIEFRGKSDRSKKSFVTAMKLDKEKSNVASGGDYWVSCLSAISNSFKSNDSRYILDKKVELEEKHRETDYRLTKTMYKRNIGILSNYQDFDLNKWRPSKSINFLKKRKSDSILTIRGLQVQVTPHHVLTFKKDGVKEIGAIWFIAKLNGFRKEELGMFTDTLYRYLKTHYSKDYVLNPRYCIAVDVFNKVDATYLQIQNGELPILLNSTLDEIKKHM